MGLTDLQLWTAQRISRIPYTLRKEIRFYAPLTESLDVMGLEPVGFSRATYASSQRRDGLFHTVAPNVPRFEWNGERPLGMKMSAGEVLQFNPGNTLNDSGTFIWFEEDLPKSSPVPNLNPIDSNGFWKGNLEVHFKYLTKSKRPLTGAEILSVEQALTDVPIPPAPPPIVVPPGLIMGEVPNGVTNGANTVFVLSATPDPNSLILSVSGVTLEWVSTTPLVGEFNLAGQVITLGVAPAPTSFVYARYITG